MFERKIEQTFIVTDLKILRKVSRKTSESEVEKRGLVEAIKYALKRGWIAGYGLAAIQLGLPIRAGWFWYIDEKEKEKECLLINPIIIDKSESIIIPGEGCLSILNRLFTVKRFNKIVVDNDGQKITMTGRMAQIAQHEIDHFDGILVSDREYIADSIPGRNELCNCGSGRKFKRCCGS